MTRIERAGLGVVTAAVLITSPGTAHAYLDAGTGSMLLQATIATFFAGLYVVKTRWAKIRGWLSGAPANPTAPEPSGDHDERSE